MFWIHLLFGLIFVQAWLGFPKGLHQSEFQPSIRKIKFLVSENQVDQRMQGVHLVETRDGARDWELFSTQAESLKAQNKWALKGVKILFYSEDQLQFTVTGNSGEIHTGTRDLKIEGDVLTLTPQGYEFRSAMVLYSAKTRILRSPTPVEVTGQRGPSVLKLKSRFMHAEVDSEDIYLDQDVEALDTSSAEGPIRVNSNRAVLSRGQKSARFFDGSQIFYDVYRSRSPEAVFRFNPEETKVVQIELFRGVTLDMPDKRAQAETVTLDLQQERIFLDGNPVITSGEDQITGQRMIVSEEGDKIEVQNIKAILDRESEQ